MFRLALLRLLDACIARDQSEPVSVLNSATPWLWLVPSRDEVAANGERAEPSCAGCVVDAGFIGELHGLGDYPDRIFLGPVCFALVFSWHFMR